MYAPARFTRYGAVRGLGQNETALQIGSQAASIGGAAAAPAITGALSLSSAAVPLIGAAIAGVTLLVTSLIKNSGCGVTCVETSQWANQAETALAQNLQAYQSQPCPRSQSSQQACETNFNNIWNALVSSCSQPGTGNAGVRCISDRQRGGKFDWFASYYDPIANDTCVVSDAAFQAAAASVASIGGATSMLPALSSVTGDLSAIPAWAWLAAAALGIWLVIS